MRDVCSFSFTFRVHSVCLSARSHSPTEVTHFKLIPEAVFRLLAYFVSPIFTHSQENLSRQLLLEETLPQQMFSACRRWAMLRSDWLISHSSSVADMISKGFNILSQHPGGGEPTRSLACFQLGVRLSVCARAAGSVDTLVHACVRVSAVSRCAGTAACCNASCFAKRRRSEEGLRSSANRTRGPCR